MEVHTAALVSTFRDRVEGAEDREALAAALAGGLAGLWASLEDGRLIVEFKLANPAERDWRRVAYLAGQAETVDEGRKRIVLPAKPDARGSSIVAGRSRRHGDDENHHGVARAHDRPKPWSGPHIPRPGGALSDCRPRTYARSSRMP